MKHLNKLALCCTLVLAALVALPGIAAAQAPAGGFDDETRLFILNQSRDIAYQIVDEYGMDLEIHAGLQSCGEAELANAVVDWKLVDRELIKAAKADGRVMEHLADIEIAVRVALRLFIDAYREALFATYAVTEGSKAEFCLGFVGLAQAELSESNASAGE